MSTLRTDARGVIVRCSSCGQKNRIPFSKINTVGQCAKCASDLHPPNATIEVRDAAHFQSLIDGSPVPILVDFWAPWCGPCLAVAPQLEQVAQQANGEYIIAKINTQALPSLGAQYGVRSIPTMALFEHGQEKRRTMGAMPAHEIDAFITSK